MLWNEKRPIGKMIKTIKSRVEKGGEARKKKSSPINTKEI
jgi:hypothetical protein